MSDQVEQVMDYIKNNSTMNEKETIRSTTKENYFKMGQEIFGIPKKQIIAVSDMDNIITDAATRVAAEDLAENIREVKSNGEDPTYLKREVRVPIHGKRIVSEVHSVREFNDPKNPGTKIKRFGSARVSVRQSSVISRSSAEFARDLISELMA